MMHSYATSPTFLFSHSNVPAFQFKTVLNCLSSATGAFPSSTFIMSKLRMLLIPAEIYIYLQRFDLNETIFSFINDCATRSIIMGKENNMLFVRHITKSLYTLRCEIHRCDRFSHVYRILNIKQKWIQTNFLKSERMVFRLSPNMFWVLELNRIELSITKLTRRGANDGTCPVSDNNREFVSYVLN